MQIYIITVDDDGTVRAADVSSLVGLPPTVRDALDRSTVVENYGPAQVADAAKDALGSIMPGL